MSIESLFEWWDLPSADRQLQMWLSSRLYGNDLNRWSIVFTFLIRVQRVRWWSIIAPAILANTMVCAFHYSMLTVVCAWMITLVWIVNEHRTNVSPIRVWTVGPVLTTSGITPASVQSVSPVRIVRWRWTIAKVHRASKDCVSIR